MFAITYTLFTGTILHRARSAKAAIERHGACSGGGGVVLKIVVTRTGQEISVVELQLLAPREGDWWMGAVEGVLGAGRT